MAKQSKKKRNATDKANFASYKTEDRTRKNRQKALKRHLSKHSDDATASKALAALDSGAEAVRRCKPKGRPANIAESGIQVVGERTVKRGGKEEVYPIYAYVMSQKFAPGHPVHKLMKQRCSSRLENTEAGRVLATWKA